MANSTDMSSFWNPSPGVFDPSSWKNQYGSASIDPYSWKNAQGVTPFTATGSYSNPVDISGIFNNATALQQWQDATRPSRLQEAQQFAQVQADLSRQQMADAFPLLSVANAQATARNLAASEKFASFKQSLPTTVQDIMASKQSQLASASDAVYRRALGMAAQAEAARNFAKGYVGKMFQMA